MQGFDLGLHGRAAVESPDAQVPQVGQGSQHPVHLHGQLAGRHQDEGAGPAGLGPLGPLEEGEAEGQGLPRARLRLAADVGAGQHVGDGEGLDGEGLADALVGQGGGEIGRHAEGGEGGGH